ncbi:perilipin-3-like [Harpia harpyja]|uniref:perilipin-3-like n=1 Tax=Harpia harpyja TaxID=202280 RepID=UPI0022B0F678|nr:perilipin-3-like [Harpia harpyja]
MPDSVPNTREGVSYQLVSCSAGELLDGKSSSHVGQVMWEDIMLLDRMYSRKTPSAEGIRALAFKGSSSTQGKVYLPDYRAAMASAMPDKERAAKSSLEVKEEEQQDAVNKVANLTLVSSACDIVSTAYASTKEGHPYIRSVCDAAEKGVQSVTEATASCVQPVLTTLEPHVAAASEYASKGLDKLEEKLPLLQKPVEQILSDAKELVSRVADVKDAVSSKVTEVMDVTKETLQSSMEAARSAVTSVGMVMDSKVGQTAVSRAEAVLGRTEDSSLPIGNEELAKLAATEEGADIMSVEQQQEKRQYFVRLGSLSDELRLFAYLRSTDKMKQVWQGMQGALAQLHCIIELIEVFKQGFNQKVQEGQEKLHQMWLDWSKKSSEESGDKTSAEDMESLALLMACSITQQLQITCCKIVSAIQGLPSSLQDKVKQSLSTIEELHASFSAANSFQDLSSSVLSQRKLAVIQEYMEELLDYLKNNTPLSWLVGPFSPREEEEETSHQHEPLQEKEAETAGAGHHEASTTLV